MRDLFTIRKLSLAAIAGAVLGLLAFGQAAQAASFIEKNFWLPGPRYDGDLPPCEAGLDRVSNQFAEKESKFWKSTLQITGCDRLHEIASRPRQSHNIPRRYSAGIAMISDG